MRRTLFTVAGVLALLALGACSDDEGTTKDAGIKPMESGVEGGTEGKVTLPEASTPDAPTCVEAKIGSSCTDSSSCGGGGMYCLSLSSTKQVGICTCSCTPKDPSKPLVADTCPGSGSTPAKTICGLLKTTSGSADGGSGTGTDTNLCLKICQPKLNGSECSTGVTCHPYSNYLAKLYKYGDYDSAVCILLGCEKSADCPVTTTNRCTTDSATPCPSGETCYALSNDTTIKDGICAKDGLCDTVSGLCKPHVLGKTGAKIGDPCKGDTECANGHDCSIELDPTKFYKKPGDACTADTDCCNAKCDTTTSKCSILRPCPIERRNGYCTIHYCVHSKTLTSVACPTGSVCSSYYMGGYCMKSCKLNSTTDCRAHASDFGGDYECRDWSQLSFGGKAIVSGPYCDYGPDAPCHLFKSSTSVDCSSLGDSTNSTNMSCRDLKNTKLTDKFDEKGFCLDDTASGTFL